MLCFQLSPSSLVAAQEATRLASPLFTFANWFGLSWLEDCFLNEDTLQAQMFILIFHNFRSSSRRQFYGRFRRFWFNCGRPWPSYWNWQRWKTLISYTTTTFLSDVYCVTTDVNLGVRERSYLTSQLRFSVTFSSPPDVNLGVRDCSYLTPQLRFPATFVSNPPDNLQRYRTTLGMTSY